MIYVLVCNHKLTPSSCPAPITADHLHRLHRRPHSYGEPSTWPHVSASYGSFDLAGFPKAPVWWYVRACVCVLWLWLRLWLCVCGRAWCGCACVWVCCGVVCSSLAVGGASAISAKEGS